MGITLKPEYLKRYKDIAMLFVKYGRTDLVTSSGLDLALDDATIPPPDAQVSVKTEQKATELTADLEAMGPIYVKIGQVLSSRSDLLPVAYTTALARLQDGIEPFSFGEVEKIVEEELGVRLSKAFSEFEATPLATASLGQVHHARLRATVDGRPGRDVVVKVQRPNMRDELNTDLGALQDIAEFLDEHTDMGKRQHFVEMLSEFRKNLVRELDYRQEAHNLIEIGENLKEFTNIIVPRPIEDYTTSRVLTMDFVTGKKITALGPLAHLELDGEELADDLFEAYLKQILIDGVFHADPHPGNVYITDDKKIGLLDMGMIGRISQSMQEKLLRLLLAISESRSDQATEIALRIGERVQGLDQDLDHDAFQRSITDVIEAQAGGNVKTMQVGKILLDLSRICNENGIRMPSELTMLAKCLLNLDTIGRTLDPEFDPNAAVRKHASKITQRRMLKDVSPANIFTAAIEAKEFVQELPGRVNKVLDILANNHLKIHVDAIAEDTLIEGFQKVSNRITTGLVLAALIIGASMLMHVETTFMIFGYPGIAIVCFLAAAGGGFWLVISIAMTDRASRLKKKPQ
jgi:predicted unusual protein kinase regulating ubiquinone biosynthesis (AarF/ABC1/UbiB family)